MHHFKQHEAKIIYDYLLDNMPSNSEMLDIGCRKGKWAVPFVRALPFKHVHCFEALPEHYERTKLRFRKDKHVSVFNSVISNKNGTTKFYRDLDRSGWSSMEKHPTMNNYEEINLPTSTIDSYNLKPYFIKIDIEGAELLALQGAVNTLQHTNIVFFECNEVHFLQFNYTAKDIYNFFVENNFSLYTINFEPMSIEDFNYFTKSERRKEPGRHVNYLALKNQI
jgi:FkbM family methyltransferase